MIVPDLIDVLAIAAEVLDVDAEDLADRSVVEAVESAVTDARTAAIDGDAIDIAATLMCGLVRSRPFPRLNRRIAVVTAVVAAERNGVELVLEPASLNALLDEVTSGKANAVAVADGLRSMGSISRHAVQKEGEVPMFERFEDDARRVIVLAQEECRELGHREISAEHLLLGMIHEAEATAGRVLAEFGAELDDVRRRVSESLGGGAQGSGGGHIPFTQQARTSLELALRRSIRLGHRSIGSGHLLLGVIEQGQRSGEQPLAHLGIDPAAVRDRVTELIGTGSERGSSGVSDDPSETADIADVVRTEIRRMKAELRIELQAELGDIRGQLAAIRGLLARRGDDPEDDWGFWGAVS